MWLIVRNVAIAVVALPILILWTIFGWILTFSYSFATVITFGVVLGLSINANIYDMLIVTSAALILLYILRKQTWIQCSVVIVSYAVIIYRYTTHPYSSLLVLLTELSCILLTWTYLCMIQLWIPANLSTLHDLENELYAAKIMSTYSMNVVAGLGTVHVPYCGETSEAHLPPLILVLVHGYGAGNGLWANNLQGLAKHFDVYAVEWNGIGRSDRASPPKTYEAAEAFFVNALERWRQTMALDKIILCGHSMGGIFVTNYAMLHPERIEHLILASPAGVPHPPPEEPSQSWVRTLIMKISSMGATPMTLVRFAGPFGPRLVRWIVHRRISWVPATNVLRTGDMDLDLACDYIYHNWANKKSGEVALLTHLGPGATTKRPLRDLLLPGRIRYAVSFIYGGDGDWMKPEEGKAVVERLATAQENAGFYTVPSAGHQLFLDNPMAFNATVVESIARGMSKDFNSK